MTNLPKYIDIELNTSCNLNCEPCPYKEEHKNPKFMKYELYEKIINQITFPCSIKLCQRGEPLLSMNIIRAIKKANEKGLSTVINTNGLMLDNDILFTDLLSSGLERLILSDYGIEKQLENIKKFVKTCKWYEIPIQIIVKTTEPEKWVGIADQIVEPKFYDYDDKENEDNTILPDWKCEQLFERLIINHDGKVRCCCGSIHVQKYIGDVNIESIKDIWNGHRPWLFRVLHSWGRSHELDMCKKCGYRKSVIKERKK